MQNISQLSMMRSIAWKGERDLQAQEKGEVNKTLQDLKQQVSEQTAELDKVKMERAADAEHLTALNDEIDSLKGERDLQHKKRRSTQNNSRPKQQLSEQTAELDSENGKSC